MGKKRKKKDYYDAAARMIKENMLDEIIASHGRTHVPENKLMLYISISGSKKNGFVFDPEKGVRIGRDAQKNEICIRDKHVSAVHCGISHSNGETFVQDFHSSNGTYIKRGIAKQRVSEAAILRSGDQLLIGDTKLKIELFEFDMMDL